MGAVKKPELLAPAGDFEKLRYAVNYGADAVYLSGPRFGLRARSRNFADDETGAETGSEIAEAIRYAHGHGVKVYVTANIFARNEDLSRMGEYFKRLRAYGADGLIVADPGVFALAREAAPDLPVHISTQANNTNFMAVDFWKRLGASRVCLARELSIHEIKKIDEFMGMGRDGGRGTELEVFAHGAMCMSYSGRCLLSNYLAGRDGNRGECAQPCRWKYHLMEEKRPGEFLPVFEDGRGAYILSPKDLCLIEYLPELIDAGADSLKIEGRVKSLYYTAVTVKAYRQAIDDYFEDPDRYGRNKPHYIKQLSRASHRGFTAGFLFGAPDRDQHNYDSGAYVRGCDFVAVVLDYDENTGLAAIEQRNKFRLGDEVSVLTPKGDGFTQTVGELYTEEGEAVPGAPHPQQILRLRVERPVAPMDILIERAAGAEAIVSARVPDAR